jgi:hypothetical protein
MRMGYLCHLPERLPQHTSLDTSAELFCTAWSDYNKGKGFTALSLYNTAIVELKKTLSIVNDSTQYSAEILAAAALLERTEALFMQGPNSHHPKTHIMALEHLLERKGPPADMDDKFDVILTHEIRWLVVGSPTESLRDSN